MERTIYTQDDYRIVERIQTDWNWGELMGDVFSPKANPDKNPAELLKEEHDFVAMVEHESVWFYSLEKWNPSVGVGWEIVDQVFSFVGQYVDEIDSPNRHYIVDEFKSTIEG